MEHYFKNYQVTTPILAQCAPAGTDSILSNFDHHRRILVSGQEGEGWQAELHWYLNDMPADVMKDTDIMEWWQVCIWLQYAPLSPFLTAYRIMDTITPLSDVLQSISLHARLSPFLVSGCSPVVARLQRSIMLS